jgi:tripartite-type tricarboxylate transporter receptor subunit TctC
MSLSRRDFLAVASGASLCGGLAAPALAQAKYPSAGPIHVLVPFSAGGSTDILARIIVDALGKQLEQSVVVDNRPGAGGNIAMGAAAHANADGYTILFTSSVVVVNPLTYKRVPFDPYKDFVPIALLATSPNLMIASPDFAKTMPDFLTKAKAKPGALNYASPGIGTSGFFAAELLKLRAGIDITQVPYTSGAQIAQSLMTGTTQLGSTALPAGEPFVRAGTLAGLAITSEKRWPSLPDVPTLVELGYPDFVIELFTALFAPAGTPPEIVATLVAATERLARDPEMTKRAAHVGYSWVGAGPDALRKKMAATVAQSQEVIKVYGFEKR